MGIDQASLDALETRVVLLERQHYGCDDASNKKSGGVAVTQVDESMRRARQAVEKAQLLSACWKFVPPPYYTWPLAQRAAYLGAPTIHHLCKSLLLENKKATGDDVNATFPKFVMVIVQYSASLETKALVNAIRALRPVEDRKDPSCFEFRIASSEDNDRLTGYQHNSVTPFGLLSKDVVMVLAEAIVPLKFLWMGGGHVELKLGMAVTDFCAALKPVIAPITQPRANVESEDEY